MMSSKKRIKKALTRLNVDFEKDTSLFEASNVGATYHDFDFYIPSYRACIQTTKAGLERKSLFCVQNNYKLVDASNIGEDMIEKWVTDWVSYWNGSSSQIPLQSEYAN